MEIKVNVDFSDRAFAILEALLGAIKAPQPQPESPPTAQAPLAPQPPAPVQPQAPQQTPQVPTATAEYTLDDLMRAAAGVRDAGRMGELSGLLTKYNIPAMNSLQPAQFGSFAADLRALGAQL